MALNSGKKKMAKRVTTRTGVTLSRNYCRKCMKDLPAENFYQAVDLMVDSNGLMSVCKDCLTNIYEKIYEVEFSTEKTILRMCRMFNVRYYGESVTAVKRQIDTLQEKGKRMSGIFGVYISRIRNMLKTEIGDVVTEINYQDVGGIKITIDEFAMGSEEDRVTLEELKDFWGDGFPLEDYKFLEKRIIEWKRDYSCQNKAEELVIKELCFKELELNKARIEGKSVDPIIKTMDTLLKSGGLAPSQTTASSGKSFDTIGMLIKQIEQTTPAEYYEDKELFKDYDNLDRYISNYIKRPIMNFIGASKSFEISDDDSESIGLEEEVSGDDIL